MVGNLPDGCTQAQIDYYYGGWEEDHEEDCDHDDYDSDILSGRAQCYRCGYSWWQTTEEIEAEFDRIRRYAEWEEEQRRPWNRFREWLWNLRMSWRRRLVSPKATDDDIPF